MNRNLQEDGRLRLERRLARKVCKRNLQMYFAEFADRVCEWEWRWAVLRIELRVDLRTDIANEVAGWIFPNIIYI